MPWQLLFAMIYVYVYVHAEWFTVLCLKDHKEYVSTMKNMETDEGLKIREEELDIGDVILWQYREAPYKAEILEVHGMQTLYINL